MKNVAVIGAGTMGNGIAHTFAQFGYSVSLIDVSDSSLEKGMATITKNLDRMVAKEKISEQEKNDTLSRISTFTALEDGVAGVDLVVEAATENICANIDAPTDLSATSDYRHQLIRSIGTEVILTAFKRAST